MKLTPQQEKILRLKVRGYKNSEIAAKLHLALITVEQHCDKMREENECTTMCQLCYEYGKENAK